MYPWITACALLLAAAAALRMYSVRRATDQRNLFLRTRPSPALPREAGQGVRNARSDADTTRVLSPGISPQVPVSPVSKPGREPAFAGVAATPAVALRTSARNPQSRATEPVGAGVRQGSGWQDRPLFSRLHGLTMDHDDYGIPEPAPEDLPVPVDDFVFGSLTPAIAQLLPETAARREAQRRTLSGAGYHSRAAWLNLTAVRFLLAFLSLVTIGFLLLAAPPQLEPWLVAMAVMVPLLMWAVPPLLIALKAGERRIAIERGLPDVLDMMNMGISQGLTVPHSLTRISGEIAQAHPALADELRIVCRQASVGTLSRALKSFADRIDSPDVNSFTSLLIQSDSTGTSISRALSDYSDSIRSSLRERADARANAASFKLLFPVALCLMPSVFLFLLGPAIVELSDFFGNRAATLNADRENALQSLQQQPRLDLSQFRQYEQ